MCWFRKVINKILRIKKNDLELPDQRSPIIVANRDPCENEASSLIVFWVSKKYTPYKVFEKNNGKWKFIGNFYPVDATARAAE